ncbi:SRPBCC family protein [Boseongicola aestuarii]|nr:SRPBCC family protein [Boseongicola aestuarii]
MKLKKKALEMAYIKISHEYKATADHIWSLIGEPGKLADWHPAIASSPISHNSRVCTLADGGVVKEEITAHDPLARSYSYRIIESPLPMSDYISTIRVEPINSGGAEVVWEAQFEPVGIELSQLEGLLAGLYNAGLEALEATT